jgi:hypothetical protein
MKIFEIISSELIPVKLHISPDIIAITGEKNELLKIPTRYCFAVTGSSASNSYFSSLKLSSLDITQFPSDTSSNSIAIHYLQTTTGKKPIYKLYSFTPDSTNRAACLKEIQDVVRGPLPPKSILVLINPFSGSADLN